VRENKSNEESYKSVRLDKVRNSLGNAPFNWLVCRALISDNTITNGAVGVILQSWQLLQHSQFSRYSSFQSVGEQQSVDK